MRFIMIFNYFFYHYNYMESNYYKKYLKYKHKYALLKNKLYEQLGAGPGQPLPSPPAKPGVAAAPPILPSNPKLSAKMSPPQKPQEPQYVEMQNINSPRVGPGGVYKPK